MDALQFAYWLQGFAELQGNPPTEEQWKAIREHLQLVFLKVTPPVKWGELVSDLTKGATATTGVHTGIQLGSAKC